MVSGRSHLVENRFKMDETKEPNKIWTYIYGPSSKPNTLVTLTGKTAKRPPRTR